MTTETKQPRPGRKVDEHEAAEHLKLSVHTLRKDRREEMRIPFFRIGAAIRYDLDRVDAALAAMECGGNSPHRKPPARKRNGAPSEAGA